jgi:glucosamine--fructose-6-phosphate aminotransferase (isomerizing)
MCGIVGYVGGQEAVPILLEGLRRLEYRGYDSAGLAACTKTALRVHKARGRVHDLEARLPKRLRSTLGIAHTRWATHGEPSDANAHPHADCRGDLAVVHNGIIENGAALRAELAAAGHVLRSETDSEVLAHLIESADATELEDRVRKALERVEGTYGLVVIDRRHPDRLVAARNGSPVVIGIGDKEMLVASDVAALVRHAERVVYLDDREVASIRATGFSTTTLDARTTHKIATEVPVRAEAYDRGDHPHFMRKEIHEQPEAVERALRGRLDREFGVAHLGGLNLSARDLLEVRRLKLLGCGSAYYAGLIGAHMLERLTRIPTDAEPASEFRYRNPVIEKDTLYVAMSQSGETADTLAAVREVRRKGGRVLGIVNAVGSTIARECDGGIYMHAGPEVAVASTKAFTCTLVCFALLAIHLGRIRDLSPADGKRLLSALERLPEQMDAILGQSDAIRSLVGRFTSRSDAFFIGRAAGYGVALEGAQKLKEISYIHAEAYPASELKHGPLALVSPETPTVAILPQDELYEKSLSSLEEIRARRGPILAIAHEGDERVAASADDVIRVPRSEPVLDPILMTIPTQILAYECAVALGRDVDRPRNLAKSVTVE